MKLFSMISLEINSWCNRKCFFCPNAENIRPKELMNSKLLTSILQQLSSYSGRIELFIYNEPMLHPNLIKIIKLCKQLSSKSKIMIATNGDLVTNVNDLIKLFDSGLTQLLLNGYSEDRYKFLKNCASELPWWIEDGNVYANSNKKVFSVENKCKIINGKLGKFEISNRSGNVLMLKKVVALKSTCARPFRTMQINWKGEVILCCNDYRGKVVIGNAVKKSLLEIWNCEKLMNYRRSLQNKNRNLPLCNCCSFSGGAYKHLLEKI